VSPRSLRLSSSTVVWRRLDSLHAQLLAEPAASAKVLDESCDGDHEGSLLVSRQRVARQTVAGGGHRPYRRASRGAAPWSRYRSTGNMDSGSSSVYNHGSRVYRGAREDPPDRTGPTRGPDAVHGRQLPGRRLGPCRERRRQRRRHRPRRRRQRRQGADSTRSGQLRVLPSVGLIGPLIQALLVLS